MKHSAIRADDLIWYLVGAQVVGMVEPYRHWDYGQGERAWGGGYYLWVHGFGGAAVYYWTSDDGWVGDGVEYDRVLRLNYYDRG